MGQNTSVPARGRRRSLRPFRSPFPRRSTSHQSSLSATFAIAENDQKIEQLNVNLASEDELMTLPGISRPIAQSIVEYRRLIGRFKKVEDLALVSGIGAEKLDKIRPEICVSKRSCASSRAQSMDSLKSTDSSRIGFKGSHSKLIDINKASVFDLQCVHGVTQELAANIIHHRDKKGPFKSVDNLLKVKGMDTIRLGSIRCQLTVNSESDDEPKQLKNGVVTSTPVTSANGVSNGAVHTPKHRKSLSAPMKISLSLGNGLSKAPINDIFDLLSAYSYRPIVEEDFKYERNGEKAIRIATWNLDRLCLQKAENLGFREVVCRTILENKFSIIAVQDIHDISALRLLCDELNSPSLRRVVEWRENSHAWSCALCCVPGLLQGAPALGFLYDSAADVTLTGTCDLAVPGAQAAHASFRVGDISLRCVNVLLHQATQARDLKKELEAKDKEVLMVLGDFTEYAKHIEEVCSSLDLLNIVPFSTNTSSLSLSPQYGRVAPAARFADNVLLGGGAKLQYAGVAGVLRQGLAHMAIPRGWAWGGPASDHCPVWCEMYVRMIAPGVANLPPAKASSDLNAVKEIKTYVKNGMKQNGEASIANGNCLVKGI